MKTYIIAGESSGDLHASNLIKELKKQSPDIQIRACGGQKMQDAGAELMMHYTEMSFMGFWEVFKNIFRIKQLMKQVKNDMLEFDADVLVLVDFAAFNLRIAKYAKAAGIPVAYYISPKIWAWNQKRAYKIKKLVDEMFVILPFEVEFYRNYGIEAHYVGNPLFDSIRNFRATPHFLEKHQIDSQKKIIALLPGSRKQEVEHMLPLIKELPHHFPDWHFVIAAVSNLSIEQYKLNKQAENLSIIFDKSYDILNQADAAVVTSGTATLETALFEVPQVVVYKTSGISYQIAKRLIKVKYISLVNLIAEQKVVSELIQGDYHIAQVKSELNALMNEGNARAIKKSYRKIKSKLGDQTTSKNLARLILDKFDQKKPLIKN